MGERKKGQHIEESIEAMKELRQQKLDKLREVLEQKKAEVKVLHYDPGSGLGGKLERAKEAGKAVEKGGLRYIVKKRDD